MNKQHKFYVTGGIFNHAERRELDEIALILESAGYETYVPHRDGFELMKLIPKFLEMEFTKEEAQSLLNKIIFTNDVFQVIELDGTIFNMNGRVPDDGATVESTITWLSGNMLCIYKDDCRTLMDGIDNPLISGLVDFVYVTQKEKIPHAIAKWLEQNKLRTREEKLTALPDNPMKTYNIGKIFDQLKSSNASLDEIAEKAVEIFMVEK